MLLEVESLVKEFGGLVANADISLELEQGEIVGLIGPNGAGKTTLFNCIVGYYTPNSGKVLFGGEDITGWPAHRIAKMGIARTFQDMKIMPLLTVEENVMVGAFCRTGDRHIAQREAQEILELVNLAREAYASPTELPPGNTTLTDLSNGTHTLTVYVITERGRASQTVHFTVSLEPLPTTLVVAASVAIVAVVGVGVLVYFKKRKS